MYRPKVFVSHRTGEQDDVYAKKVVKALKETGADAWIDKDRLGDGFLSPTIFEALEQCDWLVLILTPLATARKSYVRREIDAAFELVGDGKLRIVFLECEPTPATTMPADWRTVHRINATQDFDGAVSELLAKIWEFVEPDKLPVRRAFHSIVTLSPNELMLVGGMSQAGDAITYPSEALIFDISTAAWSEAGHLQFARARAVAEPAVNGNVLISGGQVGSATLEYSEVYKPATRHFGVCTARFVPRFSHTCKRLSSGLMYIIGGTTAHAPVQRVEVYDATNDTISFDEDIALPLVAHAMVALADGSILLLGGKAPGGDAVDSTYLYTPAAGITGLGPRMKARRMDHTAMLLDDQRHVLVIGGRNKDEVLSSVEVLDLTTGSSIQTATMALPRYGHASAWIDHHIVLIIGGIGSTGDTLDSVEVFDTASMSIQRSYRAPTRPSTR